MGYLFPLLIVFLALFQVTLVPTVPILGIRPDLILLTALAWTMVRGLGEGAVGAFAGGITLDVLSAFPLGGHALAMLLVVLPFGWLKAPGYRGNLAYPIAGAFLATLLYDLLLLGVLRVTGQEISWGNALLRVVMPQALVGTALMPLVYWVLDRLDRRLRRRRQVG